MYGLLNHGYIRLMRAFKDLELLGYGSKLNHQGTTGVSPACHLPGCLLLTHSHFDPFNLSKTLLKMH